MRGEKCSVVLSAGKDQSTGLIVRGNGFQNFNYFVNSIIIE